MNHLNARTIRAGIMCAALAVCSGALPNAAVADKHETTKAQPRIIPSQARYAGQTYGEWSVAWWQWVLSFPAASSPLLDTTGEFGGQNQSGHVWFLQGTLGSSGTFTLTIPSGMAIFMPVHNWIFGATVFDCAPSVPGVTCDLASLREAASTAASAVQVMQVTIDGRPVENLGSYRAQSPEGFSITLPEDSLPSALSGVAIPAGTYGPHATDGYWLMLAPLSVGSHTIFVHAVNPAYGLDYSTTYYITVVPHSQGGTNP